MDPLFSELVPHCFFYSNLSCELFQIHRCAPTYAFEDKKLLPNKWMNFISLYRWSSFCFCRCRQTKMDPDIFYDYDFPSVPDWVSYDHRLQVFSSWKQKITSQFVKKVVLVGSSSFLPWTGPFRCIMGNNGPNRCVFKSPAYAFRTGTLLPDERINLFLSRWSFSCLCRQTKTDRIIFYVKKADYD